MSSDHTQRFSAHLLGRIQKARDRALTFLRSLRTPEGYRYTATHDENRYPAALLYGTWSSVLGRVLGEGPAAWNGVEREHAVRSVLKHRRADRSFLPVGLESQRTRPSVEYLVLHCTNYSHGALIELEPDYDFETPYLHRFLDGDFLSRWLEGRSLLRPWEEGNNIVNVASYLALCHRKGVRGASDRLEQMLAWHRARQNPKTGGFDAFESPSPTQRLETFAGAVHNFHLHLHLRERLGAEDQIAAHVYHFLYKGPLSACLSIDLVELTLRTLPNAPRPQESVWALLSHANALLRFQRLDGGWPEKDDPRAVCVAAGFRDSAPSSCSYATWFRLCALAIVAICLLGDSPARWHFRNTLGMGYAPPYWPKIPPGLSLSLPPFPARVQQYLRGLCEQSKQALIRTARRLLQ